MIRLVRFRGGTAGQVSGANPVIRDDELAVDTDTGEIKAGDGVTHWDDLPSTGGGGEGIPVVIDGGTA